MRIEALTTFPNIFDSYMGSSIMRRAQEKGILDFHAYDLRDWTHDKHRTTDDDPYGGGHGLVMMCAPVFEALESILDLDNNSLTGQSVVQCLCDSNRETEAKSTSIVMLSPHGQLFDDEKATELSHMKRIIFVCGHYEGMDERIYSASDNIICIGDYVLTSGELASMVVADAVVRKIPGVLGAAEGALDESFATGLLEYPQYTRPADFRGLKVPDVLLSGDHAKVQEYRKSEAIARTLFYRPDLLNSES